MNKFINAALGRNKQTEQKPKEAVKQSVKAKPATAKPGHGQEGSCCGGCGGKSPS